MAHNVTMKASSVKVGKADVEFDVKNTDSGVVGTLKVSNGSLVWRPKSCTIGKKLTW
jgi:hypothetical protein